jgi:hypothetical protein
MVNTFSEGHRLYLFFCSSGPISCNIFLALKATVSKLHKEEGQQMNIEFVLRERGMKE